MAKGFVYTLFAVAIIASLATLANIQSLSENNLETSTKIRSNVMLSTLNDVDEDLKRSSYIATKRSILSLIDYSVTNGTFINNTEDSIINTSITGIFNGTTLSLMKNTTINDWLASTQSILGEMGITNSITLKSYTIRQTDLYDIELTTIYEIDIYDPSSKIRVKKNTTQNITIEYESFEDPLNTVKSNLLFSTSILPCNLTGTYGKALTTKTNATNWTTGQIYRSLDTSGISPLSTTQRNERILITKNISNYSISDINEFKGVISETSDDNAGITIPKIIDTDDAYSITSNNHIAAMSTEIDKWLNNILTKDGTTCFIEHDLGPTLFDRLEGNTSHGKYTGPGIATFIDPTILPKKTQKELDFIYWSE